MRRTRIVVSLMAMSLLLAIPAAAESFSFSTGAPDGRMGVASRPPGLGVIEIEAGDDFILSAQTLITGATFTGLLPFGAISVNQVVVEIYRVFPLDSDTTRTVMVPTRANSPSDNAFDTRDTAASNLTFSTTVLTPSFSAANSVLNGIFMVPGQTTGGEGLVIGPEVQFTVAFTTPFDLQPGHYFFVPQVGLDSGNFFWLSAPGPPLFTGDLQAWVRNANLDPDWLRVGTDIVGGTIRFNESFSLSSTLVPEPSTALLLLSGLGLLARRFRSRL